MRLQIIKKDGTTIENWSHNIRESGVYGKGNQFFLIIELLDLKLIEYIRKRKINGCDIDVIKSEKTKTLFELSLSMEIDSIKHSYDITNDNSESLVLIKSMNQDIEEILIYLFDTKSTDHRFLEMLKH